MFAGSKDKEWVDEETRTHEKLNELGIPSTLKIFPHEGHVPASMDGEMVMDLLETLRPVPQESVGSPPADQPGDAHETNQKPEG